MFFRVIRFKFSVLANNFAIIEKGTSAFILNSLINDTINGKMLPNPNANAVSIQIVYFNECFFGKRFSLPVYGKELIY